MSSISDEDDRISSLPDDVICHILSFLRTKKVLTTSVLLKRWKNLWHSVPSFNFRNSVIWVDNRETQFRMNEVDSYFLSLNYIKSCYLDIHYDHGLGRLGLPNVIINWIKAVVHRGVEDIELCFELCVEQSESALSNTDCFKLPMSILSCRTLVVINLFGFAVKDFSSISLPSLKILSMDEIIFLNVQDFLLLLTGCRNLENLRANFLKFLSQEFLTYQECQSLTLTNLIKADLHNTFCHFPLKALRNAEHLILEINEVCQGWYEIPIFHNLTNLKLLSLKCNWILLFQVLKKCPNLQNVELCQETDEIQDDPENWVDPKFVPQCLSSQLKTCKLECFLGQEVEYLQLARYILKNARVLENFTIHCSEDLQIDREFYLCPKASPMCEVIITRRPTLSSILDKMREVLVATR